MYRIQHLCSMFNMSKYIYIYTHYKYMHVHISLAAEDFFGGISGESRHDLWKAITHCEKCNASKEQWFASKLLSTKITYYVVYSLSDTIFSNIYQVVCTILYKLCTIYYLECIL